MVLLVADASTRRQRHHGCSDQQRQLREERCPVQQDPLARQQPGVLTSTFGRVHHAGRGAGGSFASADVEEVADIWALEDDAATLDGGVSLPLTTPLCRQTGEALLETQRGRPHLQQCGSSEDAHGRPAFGAVPPDNSTKAGIGREGGLGLCSLVTQPLGQHLFSQQQLQNQYGNGIPIYPMVNEQQRYGRVMGIGDGNYRSQLAMGGSGNDAKSASNYCGGGLNFGGEDWGGCTSGGQMGSGSPKSSISSDGSGGDMVGYSPAAVWEVDMHRGASKDGGGGVGGGGGSGGAGRNGSSEAAEEDVAGLWQPQLIRSLESSAMLRDKDQSIYALKQLLLCANMELESPLASDEEEKKVRQLLQLLRKASLERDEARSQYQRLLTRFAQAGPPERSPTHLHSDPLPTGRTSCNFDHPSQTQIHHPHVSTPLESLFDPVSPPELPRQTMAESSNMAMAPPPECAAGFDAASAIIDRLVAKRALPEKGKLLQAVMEAGPLLQTLMVAGSLPRWRNPPPLQPFQIPPLAVRGRESGILGHNAILNQNFLVQSSQKAFQQQNSLVPSQIYAASSLGSSGLGAFCLRGATPSSCASSYQGPVGKRQKF